MATHLARHDGTGTAGGEGRILALDGWRGVSILLVIIGHLVEYRYAGDSEHDLSARIADVLSTFGVCIFFTISGLIITTLALREQDTNHNFSVRTFYIRRVCRIIPPYYLYLGFVLILTAAGAIVQHDSQTLQAAVFSCDLPHSSCGWFAGHSWSLAYEEQFYLLFPLMFIVLGRHVRRVIGLLFVVLLAVPVARFALHLQQPWFMIAHATFYFSFICVGAFVATLSGSLKQWCQSRHGAHVTWAAVLILCSVLALDVAWLVHPNSWYILAHRLLAPTLEPLCIAWLLGASLYLRGWATRFLYTAPLQFIGLISYSLYLWQQAFTSTPTNYLINARWFFPPLMIGCAVLSYFFIERPFVRLAKRFRRPVVGSLLRPLPIPAGPRPS